MLSAVMQRAAAGYLLDPIPDPIVLKYARPAGWEGWKTAQVAGSSTVSSLETIDCGGGDVRLVFPSDRAVPSIRVENFDNLIIIGGAITALPTSQIAGQDQRLLYLPSAKGIVHIEGMHLNGAVNGSEVDGIAMNGVNASLRLQNTRISGLRGRQSTNHADGFQTWLGVKEMLFDNVTISSNYQGIKFELTSNHVMDRGLFSRVNIIGLTSEETGDSIVDSGGYYFWFDPAGLFPITLQNFWVRPRGSRAFGQSVWPGITNSTNPAVEADNRISWPTPANVTGFVENGIPPTGDYAPAAFVGLNYPISESTTSPPSASGTGSGPLGESPLGE